MADGNFFNTLGEKLSQATHTAVDKAGELLSSTRISAQIAGEQREQEKLLQKLGETVYRMAMDGEIKPTGEIKRIVDKIRARGQAVRNYREELANVKHQQICPHCGAFVESRAVFCPHCGAEIPEELPPAPKPGQKAAPVDEDIEIEESISLDDLGDDLGGEL